MKSELVKPTHLTRKAVVYVRQSTPHQVVSNQESLRLQYALRQRAHELGWHEADIDVIDADLGLSGASAAVRSGFKELVGFPGLAITACSPAAPAPTTSPARANCSPHPSSQIKPAAPMTATKPNRPLLRIRAHAAAVV